MELSAFSRCKLQGIVSFGENVIPSENRDYEQMFELRELHSDFFEQVFQRDKHWCLDRMEIFSEEDDKEYLTCCKLLPPEDILSNNNQSILIISEPGNGKTCLLYHLWNIAIQQLTQATEHSSEYLPIYVSAKQIFIEHKKQTDADSNAVHFTSMMKAIASAATKELDISSLILSPEETEELVFNLLHMQKIILLIDDVNLIPVDQLQPFIHFFKSAASPDMPDNRPPDSFTGKVVFASRSTSFAGITPFSQVETILDDVQCLELFPGFTFNILTTSQIRSLLKRWPMIEAAGAVQESVSHWVAFEFGLRAHRTKLFPSCTHSPILLFTLARRLAKGSLTDVDQGTDREFNIYELLDDLYNDCLREQYMGFVQHIPYVSVEDAFDSGMESSDPMEISESHEVEPEEQSQQAEAALLLAKKKYPILHGYDIDIGQLKRLCSLIGFLCHWATPRCLCKESRVTRDFLTNRLSQRPFIERQLQHLLAQPGIANMLGFNAMGDGDANLSKLDLTNEEISNIVNEIFSLLSYFYEVTVDGRAEVKHPILEEFMCAKFLTEPSYFYNIITEALTNRIMYETKEYELRTFQWHDSFFQTDWWWDGVYQFAGIRRGVVWLAGKILRGSVYDTKQTPKPAKKPMENKLTSSSPAVIRDPNRDQSVFEYYLRNLQSIGVDVEDLGQIRFQILLRVYSSICNHRSTIENNNDPITDWMGKAFSGLVERSLTVFVHLEVFPNYFLSAFNSNICNNIIKRCISIFVKRSTHHAIHLISKFHFSPYLKRHLPSLLDIYTRRDPKSRLAIFDILKNIDHGNLEKTNVADMIQMLGDFDGNVRREVVSELVSLGVASAQQIQKSLLAGVFENGDPLPIISTAVTALTNLVEYSDDLDTSPQQMLHSKHTATITALLEQPDPGTRLLAYICFGSPNFKHNANEEDGIAARKAALHVCARLRSSSETVPIFASSSMENIGTSQQKIRGDYSYTVALNSLISESLGETAVCWVSSVMDLLKFKSFLIHKVSALAYSSIPGEAQQAIFEELIQDTSYVIHAQIFEVILLVQGTELRSCLPGIRAYIKQNIIDPSNTSRDRIPPFVKTLCMKVYRHISTVLPSEGSLVTVCDVIFSLPPPTVIHEAILTLRSITTTGDIRSSTEEFSAVLRIIMNALQVQMHFIATEGLNAIGNMASECIIASQIPLEDILTRSFGSVRQACIYMVDKHPQLFESNISDLCKLFTAHGDLQSCYIRSAAVSTLACMSRRGLASKIVLEIVSQDYLIASNHPYFVIEAAIRTLSLVPPQHVTTLAKQKIFENIHHRSHRVTVAVIDALGYFGEEILLSNDAMMCSFARCLQHEDSEIRSATQNALERMKKRVPCDIPLTNTIEDIFVEFISSENYYQRMAAVHLLAFYGTTTMIKLHDIVSVLLVDPMSCVRIEILRSLREFIGNRELYSLLSKTFVELMEKKGKSTPDSLVLRETYRLLRCDEEVARDVTKYAQQSLNLYFEDVQVKKQAVLLLALVDELDNDNVQSLVDMLKTPDAKILTEVANTFARAGLPLVRLIPKMFGYMKGEHPTVKRKLLRFVTPFKEQVKDEYVQLYHHIITMTTDTDSIVRKKAAELLTMVACSLPVDLPDGLTNTVTNAIIEALVEINLDRNSFVRRESALSLSEIGTFQPQFIPLIHRKLLKIDDDPFSNILIWRLFSFRWGTLIEKQVRQTTHK